jgi:hypothetical protein
MYNVNLLKQNVLITPAEVIHHAPVDHTFDPRIIMNSIIIAEERFIRPALGNGLYDLMASEKNVLVDSTNIADLQTHFDDVTLQEGDLVNAYEFLTVENLKLWKGGNLWKLCAEAVIMLVIPDQYIHTTTSGVVHKAPPASVMSAAQVVAPDLAGVKWLMDKKTMDRIDPLTEAVKNFICRYPTDYPLYTWCPCKDDCASDQGTGGGKSGWVTGIYDEQDKRCCDGW